MLNIEFFQNIKSELSEKGCKLIAVSKTKPIEDIYEAFSYGQIDFGENYVQELCEKEKSIQDKINWHFIGHLQSNKVKMIAPFIHLIHGVDSFKLLEQINKQAAACERIIQCLLQVHIANEETKFGFDAKEIQELLDSGKIQSLKNISVNGFMGMASFTTNEKTIHTEFSSLKSIFDGSQSYNESNVQLKELSMGMSSDYKIALLYGSTMVRVGSALFGERLYVKKENL